MIVAKPALTAQDARLVHVGAWITLQFLVVQRLMPQMIQAIVFAHNA